MIRLTHRLAVLSALTLFGVAPIAHAQTYTFFPDDTTINSAVNTDYAIVGYDSGDIDNGFGGASSPTVTVVTGGSAFDLNSYNSSTVNLRGGSVDDNLYSYDAGTINMSGGNAVYVNAFDASTVNVSGGNIRNLLAASGTGTVNVRGGSFDGDLRANDNSLFNFFGSGLVAPISDMNDNTGFYTLYSLSGTLRDGTVLTNQNLYIQNRTGARFTLTNVPAPSSLLIGGIGVLPLLMLRRGRR